MKQSCQSSELEEIDKKCIASLEDMIIHKMYDDRRVSMVIELRHSGLIDIIRKDAYSIS